MESIFFFTKMTLVHFSSWHLGQSTHAACYVYCLGKKNYSTQRQKCNRY